MKKALYIATLYALPLLAAAQSKTFGSGLDTYIGSIISFIKGTLVPLIIVLALLAFIWGMFTFFILGGSDEEKQAKGKQLMIWGIDGFVLIISVQGIVNFLANALGIGGGTIPIPTLPGI